MKCPKCESENTRRYSMVWEEGMSTSRSTGTSYGGGTVNSSGTTSVDTRTTTQTELSKKCSPPTRMSPGSTFLLRITQGVLVGVILWLIFSREGESFVWFVLPTIAIGFFTGLKDARRDSVHNRDRYPVLHAEWQNKWLCMKCGESYVVK